MYMLDERELYYARMRVIMQLYKNIYKIIY